MIKKSFLKTLVDLSSSFIFSYRKFLLSVFILITITLGFASTRIQTGADFLKTVPTNHEYMKIFSKYKTSFGGANKILIAISPVNNSIYTKDFLTSLSKLTEDVFFIDGVERSSVTSLFTPNVRFVEVVEEGFRAGNIISADFSGTTNQIARVKENVLKSNWTGRIVAIDGSSALVVATLIDRDQSGNATDVFKIAKSLENIREKYESDDLKVHIIGYAKAVGDIADGATGVIVFFGFAFVLIMILLFVYFKSWALTLYTLICSSVPIIWLLGLMPFLGLSLDPMSILIPFLIFSIAVSHAVQMVNAWKNEVFNGNSRLESSRLAFKSLFIPGTTALLANAIGFGVIAVVDIAIVKELVSTATIGVLLMILSNKLLLPVLLSFYPKTIQLNKSLGNGEFADKFWLFLQKILILKNSLWIIIIFSVASFFCFFYAQKIQIGDLGIGVPELRENSRYNQDVLAITNSFDIAVDSLKVIVELSGKDSPCLNKEVMESVDEFEYVVKQNENVIAVQGMAGLVRKINQTYSENNVRWRVIPESSIQIAQGVGYATRLGNTFMNAGCTVLPITIFLRDHQSQSIKSVVADIKKFAKENNNQFINYKLAMGNAGVMAATNEVIATSDTLVNFALFISVSILCLIIFNSFSVTLCIVLPLLLVTMACNALMVFLGIGIKVNTLPVIALGVGVGVDYGIYLFERISHCIKVENQTLKEAYLASLKLRGSASIFTAIIMSIAVMSWVWSDLKFQQDMGLLLGFMLFFNMIGAIILVPVIANIFKIGKKLRSESK